MSGNVHILSSFLIIVQLSMEFYVELYCLSAFSRYDPIFFLHLSRWLRSLSFLMGNNLFSLGFAFKVFLSVHLMFCGFMILCPCVDLISFFLAQNSFHSFKSKASIFNCTKFSIRSYDQILLQVVFKNNCKSKWFLRDRSLFLFHINEALQVVFDGVRGSGTFLFSCFTVHSQQADSLIKLIIPPAFELVGKKKQREKSCLFPLRTFLEVVHAVLVTFQNTVLWPIQV